MMDFLSDAALARLRQAAEQPDLAGSRYRLLEPIGHGGMGTVYLVEDQLLQRPVAMKVLHGLGGGPDAAQRLRQEALILARLEHPGIVPVHDVGTLPDGRGFYVMKHVRGVRLDAYAIAASPVHERLEIFRRICETVAAAHAVGVVHRDLKPENVMVGPFGEVVVMDWGVAKLLAQPGEAPPRPGGTGAALEPSQPAGDDQATRLTQHGTVLGTPGYMAPEQARGEVDRVTAQTDIFALGAMLRFLLEGRPSGAADPASQSRARAGASAPALDRPPVPKPLRSICRKAMEPEPAQRYASALLLAEDVSRFMMRLPVAAHRESVWGATQRLAARYRVALWIVGAYVAMRLVLLAWFRG